MATDYPDALDVFTAVAGGQQGTPSAEGRVHSARHNDVEDAVKAVQAELGVAPSGSSVTVAERLDELRTKQEMVVAADGSGDYTSVAAAMSAVPEAGAMVRVKRGTYLVSSTIVVPSNTTLTGEGEGTVIALANASNVTVVSTANGSANIIIRNLKIDGNKAGQSGDSNGIAVNGTQTTVTGCHVVNARGYGIVGFAGANDLTISGNVVEDPHSECIESQGCSRVTIVGNQAKGAGVNGIYVWANTAQGGTSTDNTITGNVVTGHGARVTGSGIRVDDGASNVSIVGNTVAGGSAGSYGIYVASSTASNVTYAAVTGNTVRGALMTRGISSQSASDVSIVGNTVAGVNGTGISTYSTVARVVIDGNSVTSTAGNGIYSESADLVVSANTVSSCGGSTSDGVKVQSATGVAVTGNRVKSSGGAGILLNIVSDFAVTGNACHANRTSGVYGLDANHGTITGNICRANGWQGVGSVTSNGVTLFKNSTTCSDVIVSGNRCYDDQGTKTQAYGVRVYGACTGHVLGPNLLTGNATGTQSVDGAATGITTVTPV